MPTRFQQLVFFTNLCLTDSRISTRPDRRHRASAAKGKHPLTPLSSPHPRCTWWNTNILLCSFRTTLSKLISIHFGELIARTHSCALTIRNLMLTSYTSWKTIQPRIACLQNLGAFSDTRVDRSSHPQPFYTSNYCSSAELLFYEDVFRYNRWQQSPFTW